MAVDEARARVRRELEEKLSEEAANYLLDRPPGGWGELVTKSDLERRFTETDRTITELDKKVKWRFTETDRKIGELDKKVEWRFTETDRKIGELDKKLEYKFTEMDRKIDALGEQVRMTISSTVDRAITAATWRLVMAMFAAIGILGLLVKL